MHGREIKLLKSRIKVKGYTDLFSDSYNTLIENVEGTDIIGISKGSNYIRLGRK